MKTALRQASASIVIKLGGSLLDHPSWPKTVESALRNELPRQVLLVVGGGTVANACRRFAARWRLSDIQLHWLCVRAMDDNAARVAPRLRAQPRLREANVLNALEFVRDIEPRLAGRRLPWTDEATSDSIAARAAVWLGSELWLVKSADWTARSLEEGAERGLVDLAFPTAAAPVSSVRWLNARAMTPRLVAVHQASDG